MLKIECVVGRDKKRFTLEAPDGLLGDTEELARVITKGVKKSKALMSKHFDVFFEDDCRSGVIDVGMRVVGAFRITET